MKNFGYVLTVALAIATIAALLYLGGFGLYPPAVPATGLRPVHGAILQACVAVLGGTVAFVTFLLTQAQKQRHFDLQLLQEQYSQYLGQLAQPQSEDPTGQVAAVFGLEGMANQTIKDGKNRSSLAARPYFRPVLTALCSALILWKDSRGRSIAREAIERLAKTDSKQVIIVVVAEVAAANRTAFKHFLSQAMRVYWNAFSDDPEHEPFLAEDAVAALSPNLVPLATSRMKPYELANELLIYFEDQQVGSEVLGAAPDDQGNILALRHAAEALADSTELLASLIQWFDITTQPQQQIGPDISGCYFGGMHFFGLSLRLCSLRQAFMAHALVTDCQFDDCSFGRVFAPKIVIKNSSITNSSLSNAYFRDASFHKTSLKASRAGGAVLRGARFSNVDLTDVLLRELGGSVKQNSLPLLTETSWWLARFAVDDDEPDDGLPAMFHNVVPAPLEECSPAVRLLLAPSSEQSLAKEAKENDGTGPE